MSFQTKFLEFLPRTRVNRARGEASGEDILEAAKEDYRELIRAQGGPAGGNQDRSAERPEAELAGFLSRSL